MASNIPLGGVLVPTSSLPGGVLSMPNPELAEAVRYGGQGAAHGIEPTIMGSHVHPMDPRWTLVPRGAPDALGIDRSMVIGPRFEASLFPCEEVLSKSIRFEATLRPYQETAVAMAMSVEHGLLVMPPGAGKTVTALALAARLGLRPLVIVHTQDLMDQWVGAAEKFLSWPLETVGGGGKDLQGSEVGCVAMVQTLWSWRRREIEEMSVRYGVSFVDEGHHISAAEFYRVAWAIGCPRRYGLTATPERADGLTPMLHWALGPTIHRVTNEDLVDAGVSVRPIVRRVDTEFHYPLKKQMRVSGSSTRWSRRLKAGDHPDVPGLARTAAGMAHAGASVTVSGLEDDACKELGKLIRANGLHVQVQVDASSMAACYQALCEDPGRLSLICERARSMLEDGRKTLIIAHRVAHCQAISDGLAAIGLPSQVLTSKMGKKKRAAGLAAFQAGEVMCCIATTLADEGLDVPDMEGLLMAFPARSAALTTQRAGRTQRALAGKRRPLVDDLVDARIGMFLSQWTSRRRAYRSAACEIA